MNEQNTIIKNYYWNLNGDVLEIYVIDTNNNEFILAEISDCENMTCKELDELTEEIISEHNFILDEKAQKEIEILTKDINYYFDKTKRLKTLLYNYICYLEGEYGLTEIEQAEETGITAEEYKEIMNKT